MRDRLAELRELPATADEAFVDHPIWSPSENLNAQVVLRLARDYHYQVTRSRGLLNPTQLERIIKALGHIELAEEPGAVDIMRGAKSITQELLRKHFTRRFKISAQSSYGEIFTQAVDQIPAISAEKPTAQALAWFIAESSNMDGEPEPTVDLSALFNFSPTPQT